MCGRIGVNFTGKELFDRFGVPDFEFPPNLDTRPMDTTPVIVENGSRKMKWGLDKGLSFKPFNARSDKLSTPFYQEDFLYHRCLVPVSFYYEWKDKVKYSFRTRDHIFSLAGLYHGETFTIITVDANTQTREYHERMPVILSKSDEGQWLKYPNLALVKEYPGTLIVTPVL